jgi:DNA mismatch endonuclease (patch repair protein)
MTFGSILRKVKLLQAKKHLLNLRDADKRIESQVDKLIREIDNEFEIVGKEKSGTLKKEIEDYICLNEISLNERIPIEMSSEIADEFDTTPMYVQVCLSELRKKSKCKEGYNSKNTMPELLLRSELTNRKIDFELNKKIFGHPDIFIKPKICIFVDGNYWHNYPNGNGRDKKVNETLEKSGYKVIRFWESDICCSVIYML